MPSTISPLTETQTASKQALRDLQAKEQAIRKETYLRNLPKEEKRVRNLGKEDAIELELPGRREEKLRILAQTPLSNLVVDLDPKVENADDVYIGSVTAAYVLGDDSLALLKAARYSERQGLEQCWCLDRTLISLTNPPSEPSDREYGERYMLLEPAQIATVKVFLIVL